MEPQAFPGVVLIVVGALLLLPAMVPGTTWLGYLAALGAAVSMIYGTLLVARAGDGPSV